MRAHAPCCPVRSVSTASFFVHGHSTRVHSALMHLIPPRKSGQCLDVGPSPELLFFQKFRPSRLSFGSTPGDHFPQLCQRNLPINGQIELESGGFGCGPRGGSGIGEERGADSHRKRRTSRRVPDLDASMDAASIFLPGTFSKSRGRSLVTLTSTKQHFN